MPLKLATNLPPGKGLLSLLDEPDAALQSHALANIDNRIDNLWAEVADSIVKM